MGNVENGVLADAVPRLEGIRTRGLSLPRSMRLKFLRGSRNPVSHVFDHLCWRKLLVRPTSPARFRHGRVGPRHIGHCF